MSGVCKLAYFFHQSRPSGLADYQSDGSKTFYPPRLARYLNKLLVNALNNEMIIAFNKKKYQLRLFENLLRSNSKLLRKTAKINAFNHNNYCVLTQNLQMPLNAIFCGLKLYENITINSHKKYEFHNLY